MNMLIDNRVHEGLNMYITEHGNSFSFVVNDSCSIPLSLDFIEKAVAEKLRGVAQGGLDMVKEYKISWKPDKVFKTQEERDAYIYGYGDGHEDGYKCVTNKVLNIVEHYTTIAKVVETGEEYPVIVDIEDLKNELAELEEV